MNVLIVGDSFLIEYQSNSGLINHYNNTGNQNIFARLLQRIQS